MASRETTPRVLVRGAGDLATGVALAFHAAGFSVLMTESAAPTVVRRSVAFANAVFAGRQVVEGVEAELAQPGEWRDVVGRGHVAVLVDPSAVVAAGAGPVVVVDAIIAKRPTGTRRLDGAVVIGLGPGFTAGVDVDAVIETLRGHDLGRVIRSGSARPDTGVPEEVAGRGAERVLRAPAAGTVAHVRAIGDLVRADEIVATVGAAPVRAPFDGCLRGLIAAGLEVRAGAKIGDVDPRGDPSHAHTVSDKSRAVGRAALEAALSIGRERGILSVRGAGESR